MLLARDLPGVLLLLLRLSWYAQVAAAKLETLPQSRATAHGWSRPRPTDCLQESSLKSTMLHQNRCPQIHHFDAMIT